MATDERRGVTILKDILRTEVKLEDAKENVQILGRALEILVEGMKNVNPLFRQLHNRIFYTGSYYGGLRVKNATEFDLNLVLVLPFRSSDFEILTNCSPPSFAKFHLTARTEELTTRTGWQDIKNAQATLFTGDYLIPQKIRSWLQGVVDRATLNLPPIPNVSRILKSSSGPAITLYIITKRGVQLDVDLVPVIEFKPPNWPNNARQHFNQYIPESEKYWFLVPKPAPAQLAGRRENIEQLWRLHFPGIEHQLLYNKGCAKPVIKLMKHEEESRRSIDITSNYSDLDISLSDLEEEPSQNKAKDSEEGVGQERPNISTERRINLDEQVDCKIAEELRKWREQDERKIKVLQKIVDEQEKTQLTLIQVKNTLKKMLEVQEEIPKALRDIANKSNIY